MTTTGIHEDIKIGIANHKSNPAEYGKVNGTNIPIPTRTLSTHPNKDMELAVLKTYKVTRQTMDKRQGDNGFIILNVQATSGGEAAAFADQAVAEINAPFVVKERTSRSDRNR